MKLKLIWKGSVGALKGAPTCRVVQRIMNNQKTSDRPCLVAEEMTGKAVLGEDQWKNMNNIQDVLIIYATALVDITNLIDIGNEG